MKTREYHLSLQSRGTLALPRDLRKRHHLDDPGAQVRVVERDDGIIELHPLAAVPADQRWYWTERWQKMEQEVDEHVEKGDVIRSDDIDEMFADVDRRREQ